MNIEQIYTGCLAQGAYYVESNGEAVIIDPLREVQPYIDRAAKDGAKIKYVLETHFHADFVSGHIDLAKKTGAQIVYGPTAKPGFDALVVEDDAELKVGNVTFKVLHTPGHTMESSSYLLIDEQGKEVSLFSGDTLFLGDVGRPDLAQKAANMTQEELAGLLFDSLRNKIMPLPDSVMVYPAHGAGSACGKKMSTDTVDTLGHQKETNYALRADMTRDEFIKEVTTGLTPPPQYFPENVALNKQGYESIDTIIEKGTQALNVPSFEAAAEEAGALIIDTRDPQVFAKGFIPGSINIGINGSFAPWVGTLITDLKQPILIVAEKGREEEVVIRLSRVGYDNSIGYLDGGFEAWQAAGKEADSIDNVTAEELKQKLKADNTELVDVRKKSEYDAQHVVGAHNMPLDYINNSMQELKLDKTYYVHCASGYRSMVFISIIKARGIHNLVNVTGGFNAISTSNKFEVTQYHEPETML